ncbi:MAG: energy-coupling factor transporter ATPase [Clostridia bacterium]|nr:energy-coupling factor transporter ATPase [Clostridia bacterium]
MDNYNIRALRCENLSFVYDDDAEQEKVILPPPALDNVTVSINRGEYIAVLGHNGSGKSTFAKLLNLILQPTYGKIYINGKDITSEEMTEDDIFDIRSKIGMVFQNPDNQLVATIVEEDVAFGPENLGIERSEIRKRVDEALKVVDMTDYARHAPHKLSGGQKQRVAIAGIIAMHPEVIIFDESTAMLDPLGRREVLNIMEKLNREENITVINITHYMEEAARADRVLIINDGKLLADGTAKQIFSKVDLLHSIGLESPQGTELLAELSKLGYDVPSDAITEDECFDALKALLSQKGGRL